MFVYACPDCLFVCYIWLHTHTHTYTHMHSLSVVAFLDIFPLHITEAWEWNWQSWAEGWHSRHKQLLPASMASLNGQWFGGAKWHSCNVLLKQFPRKYLHFSLRFLSVCVCWCMIYNNIWHCDSDVVVFRIFFLSKMVCFLCKFISGYQLFYEPRHFAHYASSWQHVKQKFYKGQQEEEKEGNKRKELCNPWTPMRDKEMELILFMWGR